MFRLSRLAVVAFVLCLGSASVGQAVSINFDVDASGNPLSAPCLFSQTSPLTTLYAPLGVTFSGPLAGQGGAILNQCGNFGVNARSGANFLAFNRITYAVDPETLTFSSLVNNVSIFASPGGNPGGGVFTLAAFDNNNLQLGVDVVAVGQGTYGQLSFSSLIGIRRVVLTASGPQFFVYDDLNFTAIRQVPGAVPEPATMILLGTGLAGVAAKVRRRRKTNKS